MNKDQKCSDDIVNECLEAIIRGESEADCLARYPEQANELRPLLQMMVAARKTCSVTPRPEFRARARYEYRQAVADSCAGPGKAGFRWNWRWSVAIPLALMVVMICGGGIVAASASSLPGQPLYGVKLAIERTQVNFTPSEEGRVKLYAAQAERRVDEVIALTNSGNTALAGEAALRLDETLNKVTSYMNISTAQRNDIGAVPPKAISTIVSGTDKLDATEGQPPVSPQLFNTSRIDPALLQALKEDATRDRAVLETVISSQPDNNTNVLNHVMDSYEAILNTQAIP